MVSSISILAKTGQFNLTEDRSLSPIFIGMGPYNQLLRNCISQLALPFTFISLLTATKWVYKTVVFFKKNIRSLYTLSSF